MAIRLQVKFTMCFPLPLVCAGAVDDEGRVWVWGYGSNWQLGHGSRHHDCEPQQVRLKQKLSDRVGRGPLEISRQAAVPGGADGRGGGEE